MPKRLVIKPYLSLEELEAHYRQAKDPIKRSHYQIIWLLAKGIPTEEVAAVTGYSRSWIYELVWGYNREGPSSLGDGRQRNRGADPLLTQSQQAELWTLLQGTAPDGRTWNGRKVADWISATIGRPVDRQRGWEYLRYLRLYTEGPPTPSQSVTSVPNPSCLDSPDHPATDQRPASTLSPPNTPISVSTDFVATQSDTVTTLDPKDSGLTYDPNSPGSRSRRRRRRA